MVKKIIAVILMVAFLSSFVAAETYTSSIRVKTLPGHTVYLSVLNPVENSYSYAVLHGVSDNYGDVYLKYSTDDTNQINFNLRVKVKKASAQIVPPNGLGLLFDGVYHAGDDIYIEAINEGDEIIPTPGLDDVVDVAVETTNETEATTNETETIDDVETTNETETIDDSEAIANDSEDTDDVESSESWMTGRSVTDLVKGPAVYGGVGAVFILGILAFFIFTRKKKAKASGASDKSNDKPKSNDDLGKAEARLKSVQAEIQRLKSQDKVSEVRKRIAQEEEELRKLRSGKI
jgi:hypothetical protein